VLLKDDAANVSTLINSLESLAGRSSSTSAPMFTARNGIPMSFARTKRSSNIDSVSGAANTVKHRHGGISYH
jgi:hypothetical protein